MGAMLSPVTLRASQSKAGSAAVADAEAFLTVRPVVDF
jgi:hypothetical protein